MQTATLLAWFAASVAASAIVYIALFLLRHFIVRRRARAWGAAQLADDTVFWPIPRTHHVRLRIPKLWEASMDMIATKHLVDWKDMVVSPVQIARMLHC